MKTIKLQRPDPIEFSLDGGRTFIVQPATRARVRAAIALDRETDGGADELPADVAARVSLQVEALVGPEVCVVDDDGVSRNLPSGPILGTLTPTEELQVLWALWGQATGYSPAASVATLKK